MAIMLTWLPILADAALYKCIDEKTKAVTYSGTACMTGVERELGITNNRTESSVTTEQINAHYRSVIENMDAKAEQGQQNARQERVTDQYNAKMDDLTKKCAGETDMAVGSRKPDISACRALRSLNGVPEPVTSRASRQRPATADRPSFASTASSPFMCADGSYVSHGPCQMCPNGRYVGGGGFCQMAAGGSYVSSSSEAPRLTPNGSYVQGGQGTTMCADGSYVAGTRCVLAPNEKYVGQ
jgi:hypothetical protein